VTIDEAIEAAKREAELHGYEWRGATRAWRKRSWLIFGQRQIIVRSNAGIRGCAVFVYFEEETGKRIGIEYWPR
jgi:hypothetical protein